MLSLVGVFDESTAVSACDRVSSLADPSSGAAAVVVDLRRVTSPAGAAIEAVRSVAAQVENQLPLSVLADDDLAERLKARDVPVASTLEAAMGSLLSRSSVARLREQLDQQSRKLASQPQIEQAKGMLRQDFGLDEDRAFEFLRRLSQDTNVKVRDLAERLVEELIGTASEETSKASGEAVRELRDDLRADK